MNITRELFRASPVGSGRRTLVSGPRPPEERVNETDQPMSDADDTEPDLEPDIEQAGKVTGGSGNVENDR